MLERIKPFYDAPSDVDQTMLFELENATISQNGKTRDGRLRIIQDWASMITRIEFWFDTKQPPDFSFGEAKLTAKKLRDPIILDIAVIAADAVRGVITKPVDIGTDYPLDRVTFHLPNFSEFVTSDNYEETYKEGDEEVKYHWSQVVLTDGEWQITIQSRPAVTFFARKTLANRPVRFTAIGDIRRCNGQKFKRAKVIPIIESLRIFLSFAEAEWMPPLFIVGSNAVAERSWQRFTAFRPSTPWHIGGWLDEYHGEHLALAYPGFCRLWEKLDWRTPIIQAVTWLIEASKRHENLEGAVALCQIPLEMLAWLVFVEDQSIIDGDEFDKLNAANKLKLLLHHCGIAADIPPRLQALTKIAQASKPARSGPHLIVEIRNGIIHPKTIKRTTFDGWLDTHNVTAQQVMQETVCLFIWYITLVLLRLMDYRGEYANRLIPQAPGTVEKVPWS